MGLLQGLTEYLPVSSSGHLAIASHFFGIEGEANLTFTVAVHVATVFSTLVILWKDIVWIFKGLFDFKGPGMNESQRYALNILVSMIPVGIVGVFFKDYVEMIFGSGLLIVGICLLLTALLLTFSYRSGTTIATGLLLGNNKAKLAQFSFLMVMPPILGEAILDVAKGVTHGVEAASAGIGMWPLAVGFVAAFVSGCLACKWMINIVKKGKLVYFAVYCAVVGVALIVHHCL